MNLKFNSDEAILNIHEEQAVPFLSFKGLDAFPFVVNAFSTKHGGVSKGRLASMNFSYHKGDAPENVLENFRRMAAALSVDHEKMVCSHQTHTTNVMKVLPEDAGKGVISPRSFRNIDGLITNVPGITLVTAYADCVPLYFVDPVRQAIGLSHSGWRGTVGRMGEKTVQLMVREYGSRPEDIRCAIGPSICRDCFEVGQEVAEEFRRAFPKQYWGELIYPPREPAANPGKCHVDLWRANELVLLSAGIQKEHIFTTNLCTKCNSDDLYSHRVMGFDRGTLCAFLGIR